MITLEEKIKKEKFLPLRIYVLKSTDFSIIPK